MCNSLGKRILWLFGFLFLGCVFLANAVRWYLLKAHLLEKGKARFDLELAKLKEFLNPSEIEILEKEKVLTEISVLIKRSEVKFLILRRWFSFGW